MAVFCPLYSGSSGNSVYVDTGESSLLVDLGVSCKAAVTALNSLHADFDKLKGILITHEHTDHIKGLSVFLKKYPLPLYGDEKVLQYIQENMKIPDGVEMFRADMSGFMVGNMEIHPFRTIHDSVGSLGYRITLSDGKEVGVATDLGVYTDEVKDGLSGCDALLLESNYDNGMIMASAYPYYLKRRIRSSTGHLSNDDCSRALPHLAETGTKHFVLGHLSENNNMGLLAQQAAEQTLAQAGFSISSDLTLQIAKRKEVSSPILI